MSFGISYYVEDIDYNGMYTWEGSEKEVKRKL